MCNGGDRFDCLMNVAVYSPFPDIIIVHKVSETSGAHLWTWSSAYYARAELSQDYAVPQMRHVPDPASPSGWNTEWFNPGDGGWHKMYVDPDGRFPWVRAGLGPLNG
jgi:hypothetical protein